MTHKLHTHNSGFSSMASECAPSGLPLGAIGLWRYVMAKTDHWVFSTRDITTHFSDDSQSVYEGLKPLEEADYGQPFQRSTRK